MPFQRTILPGELTSFKEKALYWADGAEVCAYLDSNQYDPIDKASAYLKYHQFECLIGIGSDEDILTDVSNIELLQSTLNTLQKSTQDLIFGHLSYDLKNEIEHGLTSSNLDGVHFPTMQFFKPITLLSIRNEKENGNYILEITGEHSEDIYYEIEHASHAPISEKKATLDLRPRITKQDYLQKVRQVQEHIRQGDIYEMNLCMEFYNKQTTLDPLDTFLELNRITKAPFACYYKLKDKYLLCASPERFLKKQGTSLISQPIKGTVRRSNNPKQDQLLKDQLSRSAKDKAENVMVVDLVRNDLSRSSIKGSVQVEELFKVYTFNQAHHMVSTIISQTDPRCSTSQAITYAFPTGSMTGTPKIQAMELIEQYEKTQRGLFSGCVGYFQGNGDFDLNVVIRSLLYNATRKYLSIQVGSAITLDSIPETEYEECLLKARSLFQAAGAVVNEPFIESQQV